MTTRSPLFSILIPAYNRPDYLRLAISSVLENTFGDFEVIISEDRSPRQKEIEETVRSFAHDDRIRFYSQEHNLGWSGNRNYLVARARGKFVLLIGDDDLLLPHTLQKLADYIEDRPGVDLWGFGYEVIDERGLPVFRRRAAGLFTLTKDNAFGMRQVLLSRVIPFWICHPFTICYKTNLSQEVRYEAAAYIGDDLLFLYDCLRRGKEMVVVPEVLFKWRKFSVSGSGAGQWQGNLSSQINGFRARGRIVKYMEARTEWSVLLGQLFPKGNFRKMYLYDAIRANRSVAGGTAEQVAGADPELRDLLTNVDCSFSVFAWTGLRLEMLTTYLRIFGLNGLPVAVGNLFNLARRSGR